ncbi:hypothetical protein ACIA6C_04360 [Streptomyces sp. NPDC051578]|uniref:hypothetical protein n=1 Tax=Streptomyces sp. NPDC051578 TaxID=3365662 RepID=UPI0037B19819
MSRPRYTRELLSTATPRATSLVDLMHRLDMPMGSGARTYLSKRLAHYGIDVSHFVDEPLPARSPQSYTRDRLTEAASRSHSIANMLAHMGVVPYASAFGYLRTKLDQYGIDTSHFTEGPSGRERLFPREELTRAVTVVVPERPHHPRPFHRAGSHDRSASADPQTGGGHPQAA